MLNYRVVITPDQRTGTNEPCYTAYVPVLGIATDGDTVEDALKKVNDAISLYVESLIEDGKEVPKDSVDRDFVTTVSVQIPSAS